MDALDEINQYAEGLIGVCEREQDRILSRLIEAAHLSVEYGPEDRAGVAALALDYAEWVRSAAGYRTVLERGRRPRVVEK